MFACNVLDQNPIQIISGCIVRFFYLTHLTRLLCQLSEFRKKQNKILETKWESRCFVQKQGLMLYRIFYSASSLAAIIFLILGNF